MLAKLSQWLKAQDLRLDRFRHPISLTEASGEMDESPTAIREFIQRSEQPIFHTWEHQGWKRTRSKPYCLHLSGPDHVCLDWEDSITGAAEAVFNKNGYTCRRELGSDEHLSELGRSPSRDRLAPGVNLRDLWALKKSADGHIDLYILEAKGKQANPFDFYCFAEALGQVFPVSASHLSAMLGKDRRAGHGYCWRSAQMLRSHWDKLGIQSTITIGLLLPEWSPDVVWDNGKARARENCYFARPLEAFRRFLANGDAADESFGRKPKAKVAFQQVLHELGTSVGIRSLAQAQTGLRFRLLTAQRGPDPFYFNLSGAFA